MRSVRRVGEAGTHPTSTDHVSGPIQTASNGETVGKNQVSSKFFIYGHYIHQVNSLYPYHGPSIVVASARPHSAVTSFLVVPPFVGGGLCVVAESHFQQLIPDPICPLRPDLPIRWTLPRSPCTVTVTVEDHTPATATSGSQSQLRELSEPAGLVEHNIAVAGERATNPA